MDTQKEALWHLIDEQKGVLISTADDIYDHPEWEGKEVHAASLLTGLLKEMGFAVELGVGGLPTAFRARYQHEEGGPSIGLLCEYDALKDFGHGCGHHLQGPAVIGAAHALKEILTDRPYQLVIYGTPAEESFGGKINMLEAGLFQDIDVALMMHGGPYTQTDVKSLALSEILATFHGKSSHAAIAPHKGRSALDALLLAFNGIEYLREHVPDDVRMHYTIETLPGPNNIVPDTAVGSFCLRSYSREALDEVVSRVRDILKGAALMAGVTVTMVDRPSFDDKLPAPTLNAVIMENAKAAALQGLHRLAKRQVPRILAMSFTACPAPAPASSSFRKARQPIPRNIWIMARMTWAMPPSYMVPRFLQERLMTSFAARISWTGSKKIFKRSLRNANDTQ